MPMAFQGALDHLVGLPDCPVPVRARAVTFRTADCVVLRAGVFPAIDPPEGRARGTVCIFPGRGEFIEKYYETVDDLRARGFAVAVLDWRGQGGSARLTRNALKGHVGHLDDYSRDMDAFMREVAFPHCPGPFFALAHSTGALVTMLTTWKRPQWFDRVVLTSPLIALHGTLDGLAVRRTAAVLARIGLGRLAVPGVPRHATGAEAFTDTYVTRDARRHARAAALLNAEPRLAVGAPTIGWLAAAYAGMARLQTPLFAETCRVPMLALVAGADRVVDPLATEKLFARLKSARAVRIDGAAHEILMDLDEARDLFFAAFDAMVPGSDPFVMTPAPLVKKI